ncbi:hypothetical protein PVAG01_01540 [Phlyctema vagabunda]|uniref:Uncharacterized protein n=1 Tax=Phlyctema vagabunda TaxID=108571 RepID=A0ABR4PYT8_9HELO
MRLLSFGTTIMLVATVVSAIFLNSVQADRRGIVANERDEGYGESEEKRAFVPSKRDEGYEESEEKRLFVPVKRDEGYR